MNLTEKLELLNLAKYVSVTQQKDIQGNIYYIISHKTSDMEALVYLDGRETEYYLGGVYNYYSDYAKIDIKALDELRAFVKVLKEEKK